MNSNKGSSAITATQQHKQHAIGGNNKQSSTRNASPYFNNNATTPHGSSKKNATANTRKHIAVSTTPNPSPSRQQLTKKTCHRQVPTRSKYFSSSASNNTLLGSLKDDARDESIMVVHDSSSLSSTNHRLSRHTTSKICTYDVGGAQTTMKSSPVSTPDRKPFGDIGNSPTKLRNSATRSTTKSSSLSQQPQSVTELQPFGTFGTTTKTFKPPLILEEEDAHTTFSSISSSIPSVGNLPPTLPVAAPTRIIKSRPLHEIEATLKKNGRDLDSEKSIRRQKSAIMISERNTDAPLPDDMNCILYQSKPSNVNKERVTRPKRYYKHFEYSIGGDNDDRKVFYKGIISASNAANAFAELGITVGRDTLRNRAGKNGNEPSLLAGLISVKEVIECIYDYDTGFVGTNEKEVEASKDMIRNNLPHLLANLRKEYSFKMSEEKRDKDARQAEIFAHMDAEKKEREEKQKQINESFGPVDRSVVQGIIDAHEKEVAELKASEQLLSKSEQEAFQAAVEKEKLEKLGELKDNAIRAYQKYVEELDSNIDRLGKAELITLLKYICKIENKDGFSKHKNMKMRKKRLEECIPSWTNYFT